jgi:crotonobetainyl-CoA:carnitine CoA-transferase CaiB-like acyl-CoA transferase
LAPPLADIRVIDLTRWLAGPFATTMFGDMGADVIKVEKPGQGDGTRDVDHLFVDRLSSYHLGLNRNKRSLAVDITKRAGQDVVRRLVLGADVLIENFRPDVMPAMGLGYEELSATNPRLVYCSISSFGAEGPLRKKAGMDLVVQAMGGVMGLTGESGGMPFRVGAPIADFVGAYQAVVGVTLALLAREKSGLGQKVDVALLDGQISMLANYIPGFFVTGEPSGPVGVGHPQLVPYQPFAASDGRIIIACLTQEFWRRLCQTLQLDHLIEDVRFRRNADRVANRGDLIPIIEAAVAGFTTAELTTLLDEADVPNAPIWSLAELLAHPQVAANEMVLDMEHPRAGKYRAVGMPVKLRGTPGVVRRSAPELGQDTKDILTEAGIDDETYRHLLAEGVIDEWNPET